jgi:histidine triad (HIT) family protein
MNKDCIFCKIINREIPTKIIFEDDEVIAFNDIHPIAPTHVLIIPKEHIESVNELTENDKYEKLMGRLVIVAKKIAEEEGISGKGYQLLIRTGKDGGQEVPHIHLHLIGGRARN